MLSVIIPSYQEPFLQQTIDSLLENAQGKIEILAVLDGYIPDTPLKSDPRVKVIRLRKNRGMRGTINAGLAKAQGRFIMKCDAHCVFTQGFDKIITGNMEDNWLVIPRRYSLYADGWKRDMRFPPKDYHYLIYPTSSRFYGKASFPIEWREMHAQRKDYSIDDTMTFQGSCYIANRKYFMRRVGFLDDNPKTYGSFGGEQMQVGLKYWLGGGEVKVNKNTWYAHLFKNSRYYREVASESSWRHKVKIKSMGGWQWATIHWINNEEPGMIHPFSWLIEKFWPVPTWPEDRKLWIFPQP